MSAELQFNAGPANAGLTVYAILRNAAGQLYNTVTPGFEAYNAANITSYDIALVEQGVGVNASGYYVGDMPVVAAGIYGIVVKQQTGGSPVVADTAIGAGEVQWSGTAVIPLSGLPTAIQNADALLARNAAGGSNAAKTVAFYIQGGLPKLEQNAAGTSFTIYGADGTTVIETGTMGRLLTSVGGVEDITPA